MSGGLYLLAGVKATPAHPPDHLAAVRNIRKLYGFSFLKMFLLPMAIITLYWQDRVGLSLTDIMVLQGVFSLATLLFEYPSGYISDRIGYRRALLIASGIGVCGWAVYTVADTFALVMVAEILLGAAFAFISGSDTALLFESLRWTGREEGYARHDGRMAGWAQTGEACGALFAGAVYALSPTLPFLIQVGIWTLAFAVALTLWEPPVKSEHHHLNHLRAAGEIIRYALHDNRALRSSLLLTTLFGLASFYPVWLIQPYLREAGTPLIWFGPIWAGANLTVALFSFLSQRVHFSLGDSKLALLCGGLSVAGYLILGFYGGIFCFLGYYLLTAMRGLQGPFLRHHLQLHSSRHNRASILSLKSLIFRLGFVATGPLVGVGADRYGTATAFLLIGGCLTPILLIQLRDFRRQLLR